ncbi:heavy metal translocating P-type ATPase [Dyadobacter sandarakinus]|uniref:P-type Zn(2+) transporter n=1 Tax=Dyadobacter sandarakinus TaxID=2747268 RepID=A0ABX7I253_9BACT|nr:heavy metal translocating P-type ATPase [Dyadobacter sandarakinus]QRQ99939.1 cadmium-translocating P-type ATPase [Dyadobacter sandarakinus]
MKLSENIPAASHDHCCGHDQDDKKTPTVAGAQSHDHGGHSHDGHAHDEHDHSHGSNEGGFFRSHWMLSLSLLIFTTTLILQFGFDIRAPRAIEIVLMLTAYLLAGHKTVRLAVRRVLRGDFFNEFTLMTIATWGAFYIGEFSEGVAVMIFYELGELFQDLAVSRSKRSIKALLDIRPESVTVIRNGKNIAVPPDTVQIGELMLIKAGEKAGLDGILKSPSGTFNTAALTGESRPEDKIAGAPVLAGMINLSKTIEVEVSTLFKDSRLSRILELVQDATARKAPTQLLISRLAKIYTPVVFALAMLIVLVPYLFDPAYSFDQWLYRGMVFLVIACPCALTISIPLGYFGGIGLASRNGILVKGANFLDVITRIDTVVSDKTGTLTKGVFKVREMETSMEKDNFLIRAASLESYSTHPVAKAIVNHASNARLVTPEQVEEFAGQGLAGVVAGDRVLAGNLKLLDRFSVTYPSHLPGIPDTIVAVAVNGTYAGYITIADEIKEDAAQTVRELSSMGIETVMLSGDKQEVVTRVATELGIAAGHGGLLPEDKVALLEKLKTEGRKVAFVGDGVNDAPVIARADVGIAMGALGSDAAIETADIVIQNDQPSRIVSAIRAGRITRSIVYQNIALAMVVKVAVMIMGAGGIATLWEAVFADVGVAMLAILNAFRIQGRKI